MFPEIDELFKQRKLEAAEHEISKLPDPEHDTTLGTSQRYAILRLLAKLALERLHFDEAVRLFYLAYDVCPDLQQARQNRVLAIEFSGDHQGAFAAAAQLMSEGIQSPFLSVCLSGTQMRERVVDEVEQRVAGDAFFVLGPVRPPEVLWQRGFVVIAQQLQRTGFALEKSGKNEPL